MLDFVESVLDKWFIVYLYSNNCIPPNGGNTKAYKPHVDTPRYIPNYHQSVVAMITMDNYTELNGATWVLPASQNTKEKPTDNYFYSNAERIVVPKGTICFFDPTVWHAAGTNFSNDWRTCLLIVFSVFYIYLYPGIVRNSMNLSFTTKISSNCSANLYFCLS